MATGNVHSAEDRDAWIRVQTKTFTRWANQYLPSDSKIENLVTDLADGILLAALLSKISGESVGRINKNPKMDIQKLENLNQCINFIKANDIQLVNIGSSDILGGNEKLVLGLLWTVILRFEVSGADGKAGLLLWLQRSTKGYAGVDVKDFTSSWKDGLAFNALIHRYRPDLVNFDELSAADGLGNCEKAFATAEQALGIARLLDPEDVVQHPDEKSQVAYLSQFFKLFAGQAKLEGKLRAIKNAVEVTQRHDEWIAQFEAGSQEVLSFAESKRAELEQPAALATTEAVGAALDAFGAYMRETKPAMAAKRAEVEGIHTTLVSSKRNNNRPEYHPVVTVQAFNSAWEALEQTEQGYERKMLDMYLAYQSADHAVSKFNAKAATVRTWLEEKAALFASGEVGTSVPEVEANLEIQTSYENRMGLYRKELKTLHNFVAKAQSVQGHAGANEAAAAMQALDAQAEAVAAQGAEYRAKLEAALAVEKNLVAKEKEYLHMVDSLDFVVDRLEEQANEDDVGATAAELSETEATAAGFAEELAGAAAQVEGIAAVAAEIVSKRPEAQEHCTKLRERLTAIKSGMDARLARVSERLAAERNKDTLSQGFANLANAFADYIASQRAALGSLSGSVEEQKEALAVLRAASVGEGSTGTAQLQALNEAAQACDTAQVIANPYTSHTIYSLRAQHEQLAKALKREDDALSAQLMAQKSLEIPPEKLKEIQEIFGVFDVDQDGKLRLSDLKEACLGAGIDLEDDELEKRMRERSANMLFTVDDFTAFFLEEVQSGDSKEDVLNAFGALGGAEKLSPDQMEATFAPVSKDLAAYLSANIVGGDFAAFTEQLFTR